MQLEQEGDKFEAGIKGWEVNMQKELSDNYQQIHLFNTEIEKELHETANVLNEKFKVTQEYSQRV